jgi:hypothetical protein
MTVIENADRQEAGRWLNNRAENSRLPLRRREGDTKISTNATRAEIRLNSRFNSEPFQSVQPSLFTQ